VQAIPVRLWVYERRSVSGDEQLSGRVRYAGEHAGEHEPTAALDAAIEYAFVERYAGAARAAAAVSRCR